MIDKREKALQAFADFLSGFVRDLNNRAEDGWAILVEGPRDERALRKLGCSGRIVTVSAFTRMSGRVFHGFYGFVVLTDLDREGGILASRFMKRLSHDGFSVSLAERGRLKKASRGVFLHVENLKRFAVHRAEIRDENKSL